MANRIKKRALLSFTVLLICLSVITGVAFNVVSSFDAFAADNATCAYLSDMDYEPESEAGWKT